MDNKLTVIPIPVNVNPFDGTFVFDERVCIEVSQDVGDIGLFLQKYIEQANGIRCKIADPSIAHSHHKIVSLEIDTNGAPNKTDGYKIEISPNVIQVVSRSRAGLFYGVQTLRQLINHKDGGIHCMEIEDWPRFPWRGIMLDVGRHIFPVHFIKRVLDVMALLKLNIFHWHLTEDQGWRIEIQKYPKLTTVGAHRSSSPIPANREQPDGIPYGGYYTQDQVREIVKYASDRFITVVPEIEMPGHSVAALASYSELGCTGGPYQVRNSWGIAEEVFCAGNEHVYIFLQDILDEVLSLFPSEFIHIGGDECPKIRWENCPRCQDAIQRYSLKNEHELQSQFIKRIEAYLNKKGRRIIGWDEILEGGLAPNASVMSWRGMQGGIQAIKDGHDVVMTPTSHCYLDYYQSENRESEPPGIGGYLSLERVYQFDPIPPDLSEDETKHVLGAQGNLWTEYISSEEHAGYMLFPRAIALAEVVWSTLGYRDFNNFNTRLQSFYPHLLKHGMNFRK